MFGRQRFMGRRVPLSMGQQLPFQEGGQAAPVQVPLEPVDQEIPWPPRMEDLQPGGRRRGQVIPPPEPPTQPPSREPFIIGPRGERLPMPGLAPRKDPFEQYVPKGSPAMGRGAYADGAQPMIIKEAQLAEREYRQAVAMADAVRRNHMKLERIVGPEHALAAVNQAISFLDRAEKRNRNAEENLAMMRLAQEGSITFK